MITRQGVLALVDLLPDARRVDRPDDALAWAGGRHEFLRLARAADIARLWTGDMSLAPALRARPLVFPTVDEYRFRISFEVALDRIEPRGFAELLLDSYAIRCGSRRAAAADEGTFFA